MSSGVDDTFLKFEHNTSLWTSFDFTEKEHIFRRLCEVRQSSSSTDHDLGSPNCSESVARIFVLDQSLTHGNLKPLCVIIESNTNPLMRHHAHRLLYDWIIKQIEIHARDDMRYGLFTSALYSCDLLPFLRAGLTDVWSAVRNHCSLKLGEVLNWFTLDAIRQLFTELADICAMPFDTIEWQQTHGAIQGIGVIVRQFHWKPTRGAFTSYLQQKQNNGICMVLGEDIVLDTLPHFITSVLKPLIFKLLSHPQLSVRTAASDVLISYLSRSDYDQAVQAFIEVAQRLDHKASLLSNVHEAEGLLNACVLLIRYLDASTLLKLWPLYKPLALRYTSHTASTVRQEASRIFFEVCCKHICDKHSNPQSILLRLVLQALTDEWPWSDSTVSSARDSTIISNAAVHTLLPPYLPRKVMASFSLQSTCYFPTKDANGVRQQTKHVPWEWKEGRMLAFEMILNNLLVDHTSNGRKNSTGVDNNSYCSLKNNTRAHSSSPKRHKIGVSSMDMAPRTCMGAMSIDISFAKENRIHERLRCSEASKSGCEALRTPVLAQTVGALPESTTKPQTRRQRRSHSLPAISSNRISDLDHLIEVESLVRSKGCTTNLPDPACISPAAFDSRPVYNQKHYIRHAEFEKVSYIFRIILLQTVDCALSSRWELRRMADQVLPLIVRLILWFAPHMLQLFWKQDRRRSGALDNDSLLHLMTGCLTIKCVLRIHVGIDQLNPTNQATYISPSLKKIVNDIVSESREYLEQLVHIAQHFEYHFSTTVAIEALILAISATQDHDRLSHHIISHCVDRLVILHERAFGQDSQTLELWLFSRVSHILAAFCQKCPIREMIRLCPILLDIALIHEEREARLSSLDSFGSMWTRLASTARKRAMDDPWMVNPHGNQVTSFGISIECCGDSASHQLFTLMQRQDIVGSKLYLGATLDAVMKLSSVFVDLRFLPIILGGIAASLEHEVVDRSAYRDTKLSSTYDETREMPRLLKEHIGSDVEATENDCSENEIHGVTSEKVGDDEWDEWDESDGSDKYTGLSLALPELSNFITKMINQHNDADVDRDIDTTTMNVLMVDGLPPIFSDGEVIRNRTVHSVISELPEQSRQKFERFIVS